MTPACPTTTAAFRTGLDLRPALQNVRTQGAAFIGHALTDTFLHHLRAEANSIAFEPLRSHEGRARQEGEIHVIHGHPDGYPGVHQLHNDLVRLVHTHGAEIPGCPEWQPNEISVQRYHAGALGITPHLDLKRYHYLIAIITAEGAAHFTICKNRDGEPLTTWCTTPGSLVLLRAPALDGIDDGRLLHAVDGPRSGNRISISYRMDTSVRSMQ